MNIEMQQILPFSTSVTFAALAERLRQRPMAAAMPDPAAQSFCASLSQLLLQDSRTRAMPDLQALGFWLRPGNITAMLRDHVLQPPQALLAPVGTIFMLPPANVDGLFGYSLAIALLCGNAAIIRLPSKSTPTQAMLITLLGEALAQHPTLHNRITLLRYGHDAAITEQLSSLCQLRLVWGGDATVATIGQVSLPPLAQQVGFGDRFSAAAINGDAYAQANESTRHDLARRLYNDMYWYDQLACAAPRQLFWVGDAMIRDDFCQRLAAYAAAEGYQPDAGASVAKLTMEFLALYDLAASAYQRYDPALTVITTSDQAAIEKFKRVNFGFGLLLATPCTTLNDIAAHATRHDQTLTHWGFDGKAVTALAQACGGRGYDRIVPVGQALQFDPVWDGHNLFSLMTRVVRVI